MILRYYGHSFFSLELADGRIIAFDPYGDFYQYPSRAVNCDLCLISHHHSDHDGTKCLRGTYITIDKPGFYYPLPGIRVEGIETKHDDKNGTLRGSNTIFAVEEEGLRVVHCGDLGHTLNAEQMAAIGKPDLLMLPVGGYYTIDAETAEKVRACLSPKITVPMHYKTKYNPDMPIQPLENYLRVAGSSPEPMAVLRFTAADISECPKIAIMTPVNSQKCMQ